MTDTKKPIDTIRLPEGMKATTWLNKSEKGSTFTTTSITRTFKGKVGWFETIGGKCSLSCGFGLRSQRVAELS